MVATWHFTSTGNLLPFMLCSEPADPLLWPQWNSIFSALKRPGSPAPATKYSSFRSIATGEKKKRGRKKKENRIKQGKKISTLVLRQGKADYSSKNMVYRSSDGQSKVRKKFLCLLTQDHGFILITRILICLLFYFFPNDNSLGETNVTNQTCKE